MIDARVRARILLASGALVGVAIAVRGAVHTDASARPLPPDAVAIVGDRVIGRDEFARALNPVLSGIERRVATNGYWIDALEDWDRDPRAIENVRTYLADYRALTPEDVRRAVATYVTDQGDWSMLVLPARGAPTAAPPRDANGNHQ